MDMGTRLAQLLGKAGQCLRTVDQDLESAAGPGRRLTGGPETPVRGLERMFPADSPQSALMMRADEPLDAVADELVERE